ncbi:hypothetical protein VDGD_21627 [Verticillium dahliae]|nr:hypothetical protein VDGD_21627 [Verticillium dahliae]
MPAMFEFTQPESKEKLEYVEQVESAGGREVR